MTRFFVLVICFGASVFGLSLPEPTPFVYSSHGGAFLVRVEPDEKARRALAQVFRYDEKTKVYVKGFSFGLENKILPGKILVTEDGSRCVSVDDWWDFDYAKPVMIVYDGNGNVLKRFWLKDFVPKSEIAAVKKKAGGVPEPWALGVVLAPGEMRVSVWRDEALSGPAKKRDNLAVDLKTLEVRKFDLVKEGEEILRRQKEFDSK